ncbi:MAG: hypothetical protein FJY10_03585 [Bacteroidetes bacterium]|nr:hypothetical protein [Bacteroidota bacterium]
MLKINYFPGLILIGMLMYSCSLLDKGKQENALARVNGEYLEINDLAGIVPAGTSREDSLLITRNYIDKWVRDRLMLQHAINNLNKDQISFERQLEEYKNSLITYTYESELIRKNLDTIVSDQEMEAYYNQNPDQFLLRNNIVRVKYIKVDSRSKGIPQLRRLMASNRPNDSIQLLEMCDRSAMDFSLDDREWVAFDDLASKVGIETYDQENFLRNNRIVEQKDTLYTWLLNFTDFKTRQDISPLSFEKGKIKTVILNKRKVHLIQKIQQEFYQEALNNNDFEIYKR